MRLILVLLTTWALIASSCVNSPVNVQFIGNKNCQGHKEPIAVGNEPDNIVSAECQCPDENKPGERSGKMDTKAFFGDYAVLWGCALRVMLIALVLGILTWLAPKYLKWLQVLPNMLLCAVLAIGIFLGRTLVMLVMHWFGGGTLPIGEALIDSVLATMLASYMVKAFVKKAMFR
ncbi:MAG: hypothetical protein QME51_10585 [Planctomycetota bacterium]|nr:hypothetical protein [Planctomycetota bacterium]